MHFHPTDVVEYSAGICSFLLSESFVQLILGEVKKLSVVGKFLDVIVHWSNITSKQFVNTSVCFVLLNVFEPL
jgi:hypothetical protein